MSTERIDRLSGWIDNRRRPLVNLRVRNDVIVCALVDTGFNGYLLWECSANTLPDFPGELSPLYESVEVAGGTILVNLAAAYIHWFEKDGVYTPVEALISITAKQYGPGDPIVFVGTALLSGMTLVVDFLNATLRIERSP